MKKLIGLSLVLLLSGCADPGTVTTINSVYVMGDSISIAYTPFIERGVHSPGNAQFTQHTRDNMSSWLEGRFYRSIVFNNGIHDTLFNQGRFDQHSAVYRDNLEAISDKVLLHTDNPVFALTTNIQGQPAMNEDIRRYNEIATEIMNRKGIAVVDLNTISVAMDAHHVDYLHFDEIASQAFAIEITKYLK